MKKLSKYVCVITSIFLMSGCNPGQAQDVTKYTVNFYVGEEIYSTIKVEPNSTLTEPEIQGADYAWRVGTEGDRFWNFGGYFADRVNGDVNLYAASLFTVSLDLNGGACEATSVTVELGKSFTLPTPQKEGKTFLGWFDGDGKLFTASGTWELTSDISLTAKYITTNREFILNADIGTCDRPTITIEYGGSYELPIPTTTAQDGDWDYEFDCWKLNDKEVDRQGDSWDYIDEPVELFATYKLKTTKEYLGTKYTFELNNTEDAYIITGAASGVEFAYVPEEYNGKPIIGIGDNVFKNSGDLNRVELSKNVVSIGKYAFSGCPHLNGITLPENVETLGEGIFSECGDFFNITFGDKITAIPDKAFYNCTNMYGVNFPDSIVSIGESAFENCTDFHRIEFNDGLKSIGKYAFKGCTKIGEVYLEKVFIPNSVETIGEGAFYRCTNLIGVELSTSLTRIEKETFYNTNIQEIEIPEGVTYIGANAFACCPRLTKVIIPSTVKTIDAEAFKSDNNLVTIELSEGLERIEKDAFDSTSNLASIELPSTLEELADGNFPYSSSNKFTYSEYENCLYLGNENNPYLLLAKAKDTSLSECNIHPNTKIIAARAFQDCTSLKLVELSDSIVYIGARAFDSCSKLVKVSLANSVKKIGFGAFINCKSLIDFTIPSSLEEVGDQAFANCENLKRVNILGTTNFGECVFVNCVKLKEVKFASGTESLSESIFINCSSLEKVVLPDTLKKIGTGAFSNCISLKFINFPTSLEEICDQAFANTSLEFVYIPKNVVKISGVPFLGAGVLNFYCEASAKPTNWDNLWYYNGNDEIVWDYKNVIYDDIIYQVNDTDVTVIGYMDNSNKDLVLQDYIRNKPVTKIKDEAFKGLDDLESCIVSKNVIEIGESAFFSCTSIHSLILPSGLTTIKAHAFYGTSALKTLQIPLSVTSLGTSAFGLSPANINCEIDIAPEGWVDFGYGHSDHIVFNIPHQYDFNNIHYFFNKEGDTHFSAKTLDNTDLEELKLLDEIDGIKVKELVEVSSESLSEVEVPYFIEKIDAQCFSECSALETVILENGVLEIGEKAFYGCSELHKVFIPLSVTTIDETAFKACTNAVLFFEATSWSHTFTDVDNAHTRYGCTLDTLNE